MKFKFLYCIPLLLLVLFSCRKSETLDTQSISDRITGDEELLDTLIGGIRSVSVVPNCSDGSVMVSKLNTVFTFDVQPHSIIEKIVDSVGAEVFEINVREVVNIKSGSERAVAIDSVFVDECGMLQIAVNTEGLGEDFLYCDGTEETEAQKVALSACLKIAGEKVEIGSKYFALKPIMDYFYFKSVDGGAIISMEKVGKPDEIELTYSKDRIKWMSFIPGETKVKLESPQEYVWFVSKNEDGLKPPFSVDSTNFYKFKIEEGNVEVGGQIELLLLNSLKFDTELYYYGEQKMAKLFENCTNLTSARNLSMQYASMCLMYYRMFAGCTSLTESPYIDTELHDHCYEEMFAGCTNLSRIECYVTPGGNECFKNWVKGVDSVGVFLYDKQLDFYGISWPEGDDGIPDNWEKRPALRKKI